MLIHLTTKIWTTNKGALIAAERALALKAAIVAAVSAGKFVAVCDGVKDVRGEVVSNVPTVNYGPVGPHPVGSFEVKWVHFLALDFLK